MAYVFNPFTGNFDTVSVETPAGNDTEIQFNNSGIFGASSNLRFDGTSLYALSINEATGNTSVADLVNRRLVTSGGFNVLEWESQYLKDISEVLSVDWNQRQLYDSVGNVILNWGSPNNISIYGGTGLVNLDGSNLSATRTQLFQDADGTFALTSNIISDHGGLTGLSDDDHSQYPLSAGTRAGGQNLIMNAVNGSEQMPALTTGNWTLGAGWAYQTSPNRVSKTSDGLGTATTTSATTIVTGTTYKVTIIVDSISGGTVSVSLGGFAGTVLALAGTYTRYITAVNTGKIIFTPSATGVRIAMSGISVIPYTDATGDLDVQGNLRINSPINQKLAIFNTTDTGPALTVNGLNNNTLEDLWQFWRGGTQKYFWADVYGGIHLGQANSTGQFFIDANGAGTQIISFVNSNGATLCTVGGTLGGTLRLSSTTAVDFTNQLSFSIGSRKPVLAFNTGGTGAYPMMMAGAGGISYTGGVYANPYKSRDYYSASNTVFGGSGGANPSPDALTVENGRLKVFDGNVTGGGGVGTELLAEATGPTTTKWARSGGFTLPGTTAVYTATSGTGYLTQTTANLLGTIKPNATYKLTFTVTGASGDCYMFINDPTQLSQVLTPASIQSHDTSWRRIGTTNYSSIFQNGTWTVFIHSAEAGLPQNLVIGATGTTGGFTITAISLKECLGGDIILGGLIQGAGAVLGANGLKVYYTGSVKINASENDVPTAWLQLPAGTASASTAPLKFTSGVSMTAPEAGAIEFTTDDFFATITTGTARKAFVLDDGTRLTSGRVPFATTNGRLTDSVEMTFDGTYGLKAQTIYGNMYIYTLGGGATSVTISATDTFYEIGSGYTGGLCNGFTFQNSKELKCLVAGTYKINWSLALQCATANQELEGAPMINGTANTSMAGHVEAKTANTSAGLSGSGIVTLAVNDLVSMSVLNHTATNNISINHVNFVIQRVDN
jgi:hypothetical protein